MDPQRQRHIDLEETDSVAVAPDASAVSITEPKTRKARKHPAYTMTPKEYRLHIEAGIVKLQGDKAKLDDWRGLYPGISVEDELADAMGWLLDRTDTGEKDRRPHIVAFVGNWIRGAASRARKNEKGRGE